MWQKARSVRITGSVCHELYTFQERGNFTWERKLMRVYFSQSFRGNEATRYGKESEGPARELYEQLTGKSVQQLGFIVNPAAPWLGYSPDGLVQADTPILLEIKSPVTGQRQGIPELVKEHKLQYVSHEGKDVFVKKSHAYYSQCQLGMFLLHVTLCHLLVYSRVEPLLLVVHRDEERINNMIAKLHYVYFSHVLPRFAGVL